MYDDKVQHAACPFIIVRQLRSQPQTLWQGIARGLQGIVSSHPTVVLRTGWAATVLEIVAALLGQVVLRVMYTESATTI